MLALVEPFSDIMPAPRFPNQVRVRSSDIVQTAMLSK